MVDPNTSANVSDTASAQASSLVSSAMNLATSVAPSRESVRLFQLGVLRAQAEVLKGALAAIENEMAKLEPTPTPPVQKVVVEP